MAAGSYIPFVRFRLGDGTTAQISPGGLIGRAASAELRIANPEVSEAHALISPARAPAAHAVAASVDHPRRRALLGDHAEAGAADLPVADGGARGRGGRAAGPRVRARLRRPRGVHIVGGGVFADAGDGDIKVAPEHIQGAEAYLWGNAEGFTLRVGDAAPIEVEAGTEWKLGEHRLRVTARPLGDGALSTRSIGQNDPPLTIVARYDTVYIHTPGRAPAVLSGLLARIVSELVTIGKLVGVGGGRPRDLGRRERPQRDAAELGPQHATPAGPPARGGGAGRPGAARTGAGTSRSICCRRTASSTRLERLRCTSAGRRETLRARARDVVAIGEARTAGDCPGGAALGSSAGRNLKVVLSGPGRTGRGWP
jgi:hypothetical protein